MVTNLFTQKKININQSAKDSFFKLQQIGGKNGWYYANFIWKLRGIIDIFFGGTGYRRGRKDPINLNEGDFLDWWRVEQFTPPTCLRLFAEMKIPGRAWLEFELKPQSDKSCNLYLSQFLILQVYLGDYIGIVCTQFTFIFNGLLRGLKKDIELINS